MLIAVYSDVKLHLFCTSTSNQSAVRAIFDMVMRASLFNTLFYQCTQVDLTNKEGLGPTPEEKAEQYMRSYVIAWPADRLSNKPSRVPFSDLVIGLLAHSLLIQTINDLFVGDKHPTTKSTTGFSDLLKVLTPQVSS